MIGRVSQFDLLAKLVDAANLRHRVTAQNIANVNTPGYRQLEVSFEDAFARQLARHPETRAPDLTPKVHAGRGGVERADGNNVDIDIEISQLTKNALLLNAYTQILASRIAQQRAAITGR